VHVITAREQEDLETPENLALLDQATAVWFGGGRQWRFLDAYQGTQLEAKFHAVLKRGGVIGGSSAGATIQGDYLVRGAPAGPHIMMCEGYERGLGFLPGVGIDQHFAQRKRFADMTSFMQTYPQFLGIGIDEATALIVQGSEAKVLGRGQAHFYNYKSPAVKDAADYESVAAGGAYDLASRQILAYGAQEEFAGTKLDWKPLFNGKDLSGWVNVNCAPETFTAKDDMIVTTGVPTGVMRTERQYENFILELDWRHLKPGGNAGLFVWSEAITSRGVPFARAIEVQVLDGRNTESYTSHGDIFSIHGSTMKPDRTHPGGAMRCLPSERRCKPSPEWNHYRVICNNGTIKLEVNGKEVSGGSDCNYLKGYICLESEGSECHFRNLRIAELPSTKAPAEKTAPEETGFVPLYTGLDLRGWKADSGHANHWKPADWVLKYDGQSEAEDKNLWTEKEYKDFVLICDWRLTGEKKKVLRPVILPSGEIAKDDEGKEKQIEVDDAGDSGIYLRGSSKSQVNIWCWPVGSGEVYGYRTDPNQSAEVLAGVTPKTKADRPPGQWNRFIITMRGDRLTVVLNGETVIENAHLPNVPDKGRLALQHHGDAVEFANLLIKELE
jgi:cyanophycinase